MPDEQLIMIRAWPFKEPAAVHVPQGLTLADMVTAAWPQSQLGALLVDLNGRPVPADQWAFITPQQNDHVLIYAAPGLGDNPLRSILSIVVVAAASYFGGVIGGKLAAEGTWGYAAAAATSTAVIATAGMALVNAFVPARGLQSNVEQYTDSKTYSISGQSNTARPFGVIPMNLGRHRIYPDLAAKPYTELVGNDEYIRMLFCWGYGPQKIEALKLGSTPLSSYSDVQIETREGWPDDPDITLFPSIVAQDPVGVELTHEAGWITRTISAGADEITWDIEFPSGLMQLNASGQRQAISVVLDMEWRPVNTSVWHNLSGTMTYAARTLSIVNNYLLKTYSIYACPDGTIIYQEGTAQIEFYTRLGQFQVSRVRHDTGEGYSYGYQITDLIDYTADLATVTGLTLAVADDDTLSIAAGTVTFQSITFTEKTASVVRRGFRIPSLDRACDHEVRIRRLTKDRDADQVIDTCQWSYLRAITLDPPVHFEHPLALTAVRIKATGQLNGIIDNLNGICTSYAEIWDGTVWTGAEPTQNPAALARLVLTGPANILARSRHQLDAAAFGQWYLLCAEQGYQCNFVRDYRDSVWETFADICATARAAPALSEGRWSVVLDIPDKPISQHITPRNSWGFSAQKTLYDAPHAFRVKFKNEDAGFEWDERLVYDDGYDASNATLFETIEFPGITHADLIWRFGRYYMAQARLRPEQYCVYMDFEHLATARGRRVKAAHYVSKWGLGTGRVKALIHPSEDPTYVSGVVLDETVTMESGGTYVGRFRKPDDTSLVVAVQTQAGETDTLMLTVPIPTISAPAVGDLTLFGEADRESADLLVKRIDRENDFVAKLTLVDAADAIYTADTGTIPDFDSLISQPVDLTTLAPGVPAITTITSGVLALEKIGAGVRPRILATCKAGAGNVRVAAFSVRYRILGTTQYGFIPCTIDAPTAVITDVAELETYELSVRATSVYGVASAWSANYLETVIGGSDPPADVMDFSIEIVGATAYLSWSPVADLDLRGYKIKFSSAVSGAIWTAAYDLIRLVPAGTVAIAVAARQGTYLIKAIDQGQRESENAVSVVNAYGDILDMNVVETITESPDFSGTHEMTEVSGGVLQLKDTFGVVEIDDTGGIEIDDAGGVEYDPAAADDTLSVGYYYFANTVDLGEVYTCRISVAMVSGGLNLRDDLFAREDFFGVADFFGVEVGEWEVVVQLRTTADDPAQSPTWSSWKSAGLGDYTFRAIEFRVVLTSLSEGICPAVTDLAVTIDMPDRLISGSDVVCPTTGLRVDFDPPFFGFKGVGLAYQDMATGDYAEVTNKDETGFTIVFRNHLSTPVQRTFDFVAAGWGRRIPS